MNAQDLILKRLEKIAQTIKLLPGLIEGKPHYYRNKERIVEIDNYYLQAKEVIENKEDLNPAQVYKKAYNLLISAQVEIDCINHPDIDPVNGWVKKEIIDWEEDGKDEVHFDTQLLNIIIKPERAASIVNFEYKPRKANLVLATDDNLESNCFFDYLIPENCPEKILDHHQLTNKIHDTCKEENNLTDILFTKSTPDIISLRAIRKFKQNNLQLVKHYSLKSGIGAHLRYATTGFSCEYWLEGDIAKTKLDCCSLVTQFSFILPSVSDQGSILKPLSSCGGVLEKSLDAEQSNLLHYKDVEGGLYGLRIIDGITNFQMDFRSAKPVKSIYSYFASETKSDLKRIIILFFLDAYQIYNDDKANTIFLSIL